MRGFAVNGMRGFHHGLSEGRMGVNRLAEFSSRDFQMERRAGFRDQVRCMRSDNVNAEHLIGLGVRDDLAEARRFIDCHCLAERNAWLDYFIAYDPADDIAATRCPVLALNGSLDCQVAAAPNLAVLRRLLPPDSRTVVREYPGLNHLFQHCTTGNVSEYGSIEETLSPEVLAAIAAWVNGL